MRSLLALGVLLSCACGPVAATSVIADAEIAASRAHASDGMKQAPYETTSADLYLQKAKEQQGRAKYGEAMELAKRAQGYAETATLKSAQQRVGQMPVVPAGMPQSRPVEQVAPPPEASPQVPRQVIVPANTPKATPAPAPAPREKKPIDPGSP